MADIFKLSDLVLDEVSLCDAGSNQGARIVFAKRADRSDADEFIYKRASTKGDAPITKGEKQMERAEQDAAIAKALTGELNRNQINELITKQVGKKDTVREQAAAESEFLKTPVGLALQTAHDKAPAMAPPVPVQKSAEIVMNTAEAKLHEIALAEMKAAGNENYPAAYKRAVSLNPALAQAAVDGLTMPAGYTA